jgi:hypothetical protein
MPPTKSNTATTAAAENWPIAIAAIVATDTGMSAVKSRSRIPWIADHKMNTEPVSAAAI